jgi:hypothetical protein
MTEKKKPAEKEQTSKKTEMAITRKKPTATGKPQKTIRFSPDCPFRPLSSV